MRRWAAGAGIGGVAAIGALLLPVVVVAALLGAVGSAGNAANAGQSGADGVVTGGDGASPAASTIPAPYLADFQASGARFGIPWGVLAGIYQLECDFGRSQLAGCNPPGTENSAGAQGPGQFLAPTWRAGLAPHQVIAPGPPTASTAQGYATDGDGDGVADPWDPADAIASTARLLAANGAASGDVTGAVFAYNHDPTYVNQVLAQALRYDPGASAGAGPATAGGNSGPASASGVATALAVARAQLGKPYQWGGAGPASYDCSGLVMVAYGAGGLALPHNAAAQYADTAAHRVALGAVVPGDLVFFGSSPATIGHVGIVVGDGNMIDAPHTGADVRVEPYNWPDLYAATRPLG